MSAITKQDALIAAILAALKSAPAIAAGNVFEDDEVDGLPEGMSQAVLVGLGTSTPAEIVASGQPMDWTTRVRITTAVRRDSRIASGRPSRTLQNDVYERLMADAGVTAAAMTFDLKSLQPADPARFDTRVGAMDAVYVATHRSAWNTLS